MIPTPVRAPNANAFAERWIRSTREECLNKLPIVNQAHLRRMMREYIAFLNTARPHQGLEQRIPARKTTHENTGPVRCRAVLGGINHDYYRDAREGRNRLLHGFFETAGECASDAICVEWQTSDATSTCECKATASCGWFGRGYTASD